MRIAVYHNLPSGGARRALREQVHGLQQRGHEVAVWTTACSDRTYLPLPPGIREQVLPWRGVWSVPASVWPRGMDLWMKMNGPDAPMNGFARRAAAEIERGGYDVLLCSPCRYQAAPAIALYTALPSLLFAHEPYRRLYEPARGGLPLWHAARRRAGERARAQAYTVLCANSAFMSHQLEGIYGREARVNYLGIDNILFHPGDGTREDRIVGLGALQPHKRVDLALQTVARLRSPRPVLTWIANMASPGYLRAMQRLARELGVAFEPLLRIDDDRLVQLLGRARALLYTSRAEPFGFAPLEASACGTPVVGVAEGGVRETVRDGVNGYTAPADPVALAAVLQPVLDDPAQAEELGRRGREWVCAEWTWSAHLDRLEDTLVKLAALHPTVKRKGRERQNQPWVGG